MSSCIRRPAAKEIKMLGRLGGVAAASIAETVTLTAGTLRLDISSIIRERVTESDICSAMLGFHNGHAESMGPNYREI